MKHLKKEEIDHDAMAKGIQKFQLINDGAALKNKQKYQDFRMQLVDQKFQCSNVVALCFGKFLSTKSNKMAELA